MTSNPTPLTGFLTWKTFRFTIAALTPISLPAYKGSTFRGALMMTFKNLVCAVRNSECSNCLLAEKCLYNKLFEAGIPKEHPDAAKYAKAPRPYVLNPPATRQQKFEPGAALSFDLVLIGPAVEALPYFVYTFTRLGEKGLGRGRGKFRLLTVDREENDKFIKIYDHQTDTLTQGAPRKTMCPLTPPSKTGSVCLEFTTPLRIKAGKKLVTRLTFPVFFQHLTHRLSLLTDIYGLPEKMPDLRTLLANAEKITTRTNEMHWHDWDRYSGRQKTRMQFGGLLGVITFDGDLTDYLPYIRMGEQLNVGQLTTFGLGRYRMM